MIWSDKCIKEAQRMGKINITPFNEDMIQPNSIDLTLDDMIMLYDYELDEFADLCLSEMSSPFILEPGDFILASTAEEISLGNGVCGQVDGKSSYGRKGLRIHQTAGWIDSGFRGNVTLEMDTIGQDIVLEVGMPICQLVLYDAYPSERPYGSEGLNSHYQGQTGVTKSWMT